MPIKLSACFDTRRKKWCSAKIRVLPAHDIKDAQAVLKEGQANILVADKAYDANSLHLFCKSKGMQAHIPLRNFGKSKHQAWSARKMSALYFRQRTFHRRVLIETKIESLKRTTGTSVSSKRVKTIRADLYG